MEYTLPTFNKILSTELFFYNVQYITTKQHYINPDVGLDS